MIKKIILKTERKTESSIVIGENCIENLCTLVDLTKRSSIGVIFDKTTQKLFGQKIQSVLDKSNILFAPIIIPDGEQSKSIETTQIIYKQLLDHGLNRNSLLIAVGGGVVGDLTGFVASTFMRGIDYVNIPTTLLAQVDATIGGKTGVNFDGLKNMIGVFHQPRLIVCDVDLLSSLPQRQMRTGLAEVIKYGLITDREIFQLLEKKGEDLSIQELIQLITKSISIKGTIVEKDPFEKLGIREILNFGHTFGHAVEAISNGALSHGEAISIGMVFAARLSQKVGLVDEKIVMRIENTLSKLSLPIKYKGDKKIILQKIAHDKKNVDKTIKWVLLEAIGKAISSQEVSDSIINTTLEEIIL